LSPGPIPTNGLWLLIAITEATNNGIVSEYANLTLVNTTFDEWYRLENRTNLVKQPVWEWGEDMRDSAGTNAITFSPLDMDTNVQWFFQAVGLPTGVSVLVDNRFADDPIVRPP